jgi:hypothetical protein
MQVGGGGGGVNLVDRICMNEDEDNLDNSTKRVKKGSHQGLNKSSLFSFSSDFKFNG